MSIGRISSSVAYSVAYHGAQARENSNESIDRRRCAGPEPYGGACRPLQREDRAIRAGGAPVRRKPERRANGAAVDRRADRPPTDARLGQTGAGAGAVDV